MDVELRRVVGRRLARVLARAEIDRQAVERLHDRGLLGPGVDDGAGAPVEDDLTDHLLSLLRGAGDRHRLAANLGEEGRHVPRLDALAPLANGCRLDQFDAQREQAARIQHGHDLMLAVGGQRTLVAAARVGQCFVGEIRHNVPQILDCRFQISD